jgi:nicotinamide mononucleotide (NMN) deamidase PncC
VTVTLDGNQVATAVTFNTAQQAAKAPAAAAPTASATTGTGGPGGGTAGPPARQHRVGHRFDNPSRM